MLEIILLVAMGLVGFFFFLWGLEFRITRMELTRSEQFIGLIFLLAGLTTSVMSVHWLL